MKTRTSYVAIAILVVAVTLSTSAAYAQGSFSEQACPDCEGNVMQAAAQAILSEQPIAVWTDSAVYDHDSVITVQGTVSAIRPGTDVGLVVIGPPPFNNIVSIQQIDIRSDKTYSTTLSTKGGLWKYDGTYTIRVTYGTQEVFDKVIVELTGGIIGMPTVTCERNEIAASGQCIPFSISGATVSGARINVDTTTLIININTSDDGSITLEIPRNVLDTDSTSDPLFVLVDGEEVDSEETATRTVRTVTIMFLDGAEEIEIIGTFAIPEFGTIAALILAVAIISIIAVTAKTRLNVLPKY